MHRDEIQTRSIFPCRKIIAVDAVFQKDFQKYVVLPSNAQVRHVWAMERLAKLKSCSETLPINRMEKLPRGWGVMLDDTVAGFFSNLLVQGYCYFGGIG